jgi:hypothetical protein
MTKLMPRSLAAMRVYLIETTMPPRWGLKGGFALGSQGFTLGFNIAHLWC